MCVASELIYMDTDFIENALDSSGAASSSSSLYAECREITAILPSALEARQAPPAKANVGNPQNASGTTTSTRMYSYVVKPSEVASDGTNGSPGCLRQPLTRTVSSGPQAQQLTEYEYVDVPAVPPRKVRPASVRLPVSVLERPDSVSYVSSSNDATASDGAPLPNFKPVVPQRNFVVNSSKPHSAAAPLPLRDPRDSSTTAKPTPSASSDFYAEGTYQRPPTLPDRRPAAAAPAAAQSSDDSDGASFFSCTFFP